MFMFKNFIGFQSRLSRDSVDWSSTQSRLKFFQSTPVDSVAYASLEFFNENDGIKKKILKKGLYLNFC